MEYHLLVGRTLDEARALLPRDPVVVTTAPPFEPRFRKPVWGEFRVLRARETETGVELLVARELLAEIQLPREEKERPAKKPKSQAAPTPQAADQTSP